MDDCTKWIWHGEGIDSEKTKTSDVDYGSKEDSMHNNKKRRCRQ